MRKPTMGNLFSGSGAWELAAELCGIDVLFEAEIEPFPVALEAKRFPNAIQLGDVSKINGADIPPVDIFTNSSPCQDLSIAGKRSGLDGERSGLFMQAVRITKEMREKDEQDGRTNEFIRPRFWCWENVPGAFSSANGEDFRTVLESVAEIPEKKHVDIPIPRGGWHYAGVLDGKQWQIAWRTLDAQFFGVPQRRRRIFLVADFAGHRAGEILFERKGLSRHFKKIAETWQDTSRTLEERIREARTYVSDAREMVFGQQHEVKHRTLVVYDGENITSPTNASNPQPGDPCHTLDTDSRNYLVDNGDSPCVRE